MLSAVNGVTARQSTVSSPAADAQRALGKLALTLAGVWGLLLVITIVVAAQGSLHLPAITMPLLIVPGFAFVPAARYVIKVHQAEDHATEKALLGKAWLLAAVGLVLGIAVTVILNHVKGGSIDDTRSAVGRAGGNGVVLRPVT
ncbi:hypothetical protein [Actinoplanes couchii]|uniref:Uncharacterized protein n=1 Tax=Actinoplanes couchii TaxID=403638 RepID=A0ABQ3XJF6_9ACTN|nr:hypothetical protein [Actinoplanes couchii]MDR6324389.1 hypothetical protein [Actinoplanes couchii]GID58610.1 hypothetical protein Aco03nite_070140 [Actinoplanes couchii]